MRTNRAGLRFLVILVAGLLIAGCIISYALGVTDGKECLLPAISDLQACNKELSADLYAANKELNARENLINWASLYIKKKGAK